ncbi:DUF2520 domain-containing protein [Leucobacter zeae]|nr:DUF2520 domain-containing protein [Leucobacter zeae]
MRIQVIGRGRMGAALERSLAEAGAELLPALGRRDVEASAATGRLAGEADLVLLAVPDAAIADVARRIAPGRLVGHLSGITGIAALAPHEAFGLHPLMTVAGPDARFAGAYAAVDGGTPRALAAAERLAERLGMRTFRVADADRAAYHASASIASNFLVVLEGVAERLAATAGVPREALVPLAEAALRNWGAAGAESALTGPIARGDTETAERQRAAVADRLPDSLRLFDALADATRSLAGRRTASDPEPEETA